MNTPATDDLRCHQAREFINRIDRIEPLLGSNCMQARPSAEHYRLLKRKISGER